MCAPAHYDDASNICQALDSGGDAPQLGELEKDWGIGAAGDAKRAAAAARDAADLARTLEQVVAYCEGMQRLIHAQCLTLSQRFGCPPELADVAKAIWFPYLQSTGQGCQSLLATS